jgi:anion-transporting  ArsA/GET3 family ATPase
MKQVSQQKIIFVTGKGGVGKSAVAAGIALKQARASRKTLLVELGYQSFYEDYFHLEKVGYQAQNLKPNLDLALWSGPECLKEYARHLLKVESLYRLFFENSVTKALIQVAPGLAELAILGKVTSHPRRVGPPLNYDCIVIDAFATGHFLALLRAPHGMAEAIRFGPMGDQSRSIEKILKDPQMCEYFVVSFPEELPVVEGIELWQGIYDIVKQKPVHIFNRVLDPAEAAMNAKAPALEPFQKYLAKVSTAETNLYNQLKMQGEVHTLPQVFSVDAWDVVSQIAEALP